MALESEIDELSDPSKRLSARHLADLSDLDAADARRLADAWPSIVPERRFSIVSELTELTEDNVDLNFDAVFKTALADGDANVRAAALRGLAEYEGRDLIAVLADLLRNDADAGFLRDDDAEAIRATLIESAEDADEDERVRARAVEALGALSGDETDNLIESIYGEESLWLKVGAVDAMGRSCSETWLPVVIRELENQAPEMRHAAAFAAGEIGDESAIPPLKHVAIEDPDPEVRLAAVHALGEIGGKRARVAPPRV